MDTRLTLPRPTAITHVVPSAVFRVAKTRVRRAGYSHTVAVKGTEGAWPPWECTERVTRVVPPSFVSYGLFLFLNVARNDTWNARHVRVKVIENEIVNSLFNSIIFLFVNSLHLQSHSPSPTHSGRCPTDRKTMMVEGMFMMSYLLLCPT